MRLLFGSTAHHVCLAASSWHEHLSYSVFAELVAGCWYADNGVKFEGQSAYDSDYHAHPLERRAPMHPAPPPRNTAKFDGTSTYHVSQSASALCPS